MSELIKAYNEANNYYKKQNKDNILTVDQYKWYRKNINNSIPSIFHFIKKYKTWNKFKLANNFKINLFEKEYDSKKVMISNLQYVYKCIGKKNLYLKDYLNYESDKVYNYNYIINVFGTWNNYKKAAGIIKLKYTKEEVQDSIYKAIAYYNDTNISGNKYSDFVQMEGGPSYGYLTNTYKSWNNVKLIFDFKQKVIDIIPAFCRECAERQECTTSLDKCEYYDEDSLYFQDII